jgi:hypothetical protein
MAGDECSGLDDKTLQRILQRQFELKKLPRTTEDWMDVIDLRHLLTRLSDSPKFTSLWVKTRSGDFPVKLEFADN